MDKAQDFVATKPQISELRSTQKQVVTYNIIDCPNTTST